MVDKVMDSGAELERKRAILFRAFELSAGQLARDAEQIEANAIVNELPIKKRHEMMSTASSLRVASGWLLSLCPQRNDDPGLAKPA